MVKRFVGLVFFVCLLTGDRVGAMHRNSPTPSSPQVKTSWIDYVFDTLSIWENMLRNPLEVSAFTASSPWVIKTIAEHMTIGDTLEIGAGPGTLSEPLAGYLQAYAERDGKKYRYDAVECLHDLYEELTERLEELPNAQTYCNFFDEEWQPSGIASSDNLYNTVISTIPITCLSHKTVEAILNKVLRMLKPGGKFIYVSLAGARALGKIKTLLRSLAVCHLQRYLELLEKLETTDRFMQEHFDQHEVIVYRNVTPMRVYVAAKKRK